MYWGSFVCEELFSSHCYKGFFLFFDILTRLCLGLDLSTFVLLGICWTSWRYRLIMCFIKFESFLLLFEYFFLLSSLLPFWYFHYTYFAVLNESSHFSETLYTFTHSFFSLFCSTPQMALIYCQSSIDLSQRSSVILSFAKATLGPFWWIFFFICYCIF